MVSLYLTDAPGDVSRVWLEIESVTFVGGGPPVTVLNESTGLVEITSLVDEAMTLVQDLEVQPDGFRQPSILSSSREDTAHSLSGSGIGEPPRKLKLKKKSASVGVPGTDPSPSMSQAARQSGTRPPLKRKRKRNRNRLYAPTTATRTRSTCH